MKKPTYEQLEKLCVTLYEATKEASNIFDNQPNLMVELEGTFEVVNDAMAEFNNTFTTEEYVNIAQR